MPRVLTETKHYQTASLLREYVNSLPAGTRLPVTRELMEILNASHGTVIHALKTLAGDGLIARQFGKQRYFVAEQFERYSAKICLIRPDYPSLSLDSMVRGIYEAGQRMDWKFIYHTYRTFAELNLAREIGDSDACILLPPAKVIDREMIRILKRPSVPVVVLLQHVESPELANVVVDDLLVGKIAAETFYAYGHRKILVLYDQPHESTTAERLQGFFQTLSSLGIPESEHRLLDMELDPKEGALDGCYRIFSDYLDQGNRNFTGVFTLSLSGAAAALRALREHGLEIPEDVSVLSYGGEVSLAAYLNPPLSTIEIEAGKFGEESIRLIDNMLRNRELASVQYRILPKLVLRNTLMNIQSDK